MIFIVKCEKSNMPTASNIVKFKKGLQLLESKGGHISGWLKIKSGCRSGQVVCFGLILPLKTHSTEIRQPAAAREERLLPY